MRAPADRRQWWRGRDAVTRAVAALAAAALLALLVAGPRLTGPSASGHTRPGADAAALWAATADVPPAGEQPALPAVLGDVALTPAVVTLRTTWQYPGDGVARHRFTLSVRQRAETRGLYGVIRFTGRAAIVVNGVRAVSWDVATADAGGADAATTATTRRFSIPGALLRTGTNTITVIDSGPANATTPSFTMPIVVRTKSYLPAGYTASQLARHYPSDDRPQAPGGEDYRTPYLAGFTALLANNPDVLAPRGAVPHGERLRAANDVTAVEINRRATNADRKRALADATGTRYQRLADGLGPLEDAYLAGLTKGLLPKTVELLSERAEANIGHGTDDIKDFYHYPRPFVRLGFTDDGGDLVRVDSSSHYDDDRKSWSFPSGHTLHGYIDGVLLATLIPEEGPQILARTADYANHRIVLGVHYPLDVIGGRIAGTAVAEMRWADPEFRPLLLQAKAELDTVLAEECGTTTVAACVARPNAAPPYLPTGQAVKIYTKRLSYDLPRVHRAGRPLTLSADVADLLRTTFPDATTAQRRAVVARTALDSGYPLDLSYRGKPGRQRVNLAAAMAAHLTTR